MPNSQELRLQQTQMLSHQDFRLQQTQMLSNQDFRSAQAIPSPKQEHHNNTSARSLPSRARKGYFCAFLAFGTLIFGHFEHKIGVFVRFWGLKPLFSGFSSTKSGFLCAFCLQTHHFRAFRAQNRGFCAREEGQVASGSVKVTFVQITAQASKMQAPHNQIINF